MPAGSAPHFPIEERVARFQRFYQRANERPLLGFFVGSDYPLRRYRGSDSLPSARPSHRRTSRSGRTWMIATGCSICTKPAGGDFIWKRDVQVILPG